MSIEVYIAQAGFGPDLSGLYCALIAFGLGVGGALCGVLALILSLSKKQRKIENVVIANIGLAFSSGATILWLLALPNGRTIFPVLLFLLGAVSNAWVIFGSKAIFRSRE